MRSYIKHCSRLLKSIIDSECQNPDNFKDSSKNFIRNRKLSRNSVAYLPFQFDSDSISIKIPHFSGISHKDVSPSAVCQARGKILPNLYSSVFYRFNQHPDICFHSLFKGFFLLAVDGSEIRCPSPRNDSTAFGRSKNGRTRSFYHLNTLYSVLDHLFLDAVIQPGSKKK